MCTCKWAYIYITLIDHMHLCAYMYTCMEVIICLCMQYADDACTWMHRCMYIQVHMCA